MSANGKTGPPITRGGSGLPSRVIFHGLEGVGKTSVAAHATRPVFSMTRNETGLLTLIDNGIVGPTDHFDETFSWSELLRNIGHLIEHDTGHRTYVLDTLNGAERLCSEFVCAQKFDGDWAAFLAYGRGLDQAQGEWLRFLTRLDELRQLRKMTVICLAHTQVKTFKNPEGEDYDRWTPDMSKQFWSLSHKWADVILFGNHYVEAKKERGATKAKGKGGDQRFFYTTRAAAYDAKNRVGLPLMIPMGRDGKEAWTNLKNAMAEARKKATTQQQQTANNETHMGENTEGQNQGQEVTSNG